MNPWGLSLGDESIVLKDKVIQTSNQWRNAYDGNSSDEHYCAFRRSRAANPIDGGQQFRLIAGSCGGRQFGSCRLSLAVAL
jgi:hypothetical protein